MENEAKKPLELYIHVPFCVKKCDYCDFLSGQYLYHLGMADMLPLED